MVLKSEIPLKQVGGFEFQLYFLLFSWTCRALVFHSPFVTTTTTQVHVSRQQRAAMRARKLILLTIVKNFSPAVDILISSARSVAHSGLKTYIQEGRRRALLLQDVHVFLGCLNMS